MQSRINLGFCCTPNMCVIVSIYCITTTSWNTLLCIYVIRHTSNAHLWIYSDSHIWRQNNIIWHENTSFCRQNDYLCYLNIYISNLDISHACRELNIKDVEVPPGKRCTIDTYVCIYITLHPCVIQVVRELIKASVNNVIDYVYHLITRKLSISDRWILRRAFIIFFRFFEKKTSIILFFEEKKNHEHRVYIILFLSHSCVIKVSWTNESSLKIQLGPKWNIFSNRIIDYVHQLAFGEHPRGESLKLYVDMKTRCVRM